jgi:hypothetical protein
MSAPYLILGFVVLPLWIAAGFADYLCHRAARIQENSGTPESLLHLIQFGLVGVPLTLGLFLRPNAGFFLLGAVCILLHHAVAYIDVRYANGTRTVAPREQMVHSFLELLPITAFLILGTAAWPQLLSLLRLSPEAARFAPEPRLISAGYAAALLASAFFLNLVPYVEELTRCMRFGRKMG